MKKILAATAALALSLAGMATRSNKPETMSDTTNRPAGATVELTTSEGPVKVLLYDDTPQHRDNFLKLVEEGYYDGLLFHRVIKDFMVQTGDPNSRDAAPGQRLGAGDPSYTVPAEIRYPEHYNKRGALAAARTGDEINPERRSSGSQFYIVTGRPVDRRQLEVMWSRNHEGALQERFRELVTEHQAEIDSLRSAGDREGLEALRRRLIEQTRQEVSIPPLPEEMAAVYAEQGGAPHLDGAYTVFGEVTEGMDVVDRIQQAATDKADRPVEDIRIIKAEVLSR